MKSADFEKSVWQLLDGSLDEQGFQELESYLAEHEEEQDRFIELVDLHGTLMQKLMLGSSESSVLVMDEVLRRQKRRSFIRSSIAAAAILMLLGVVMKVVWLKPPEPLLTFRHSTDAAFVVTHADPDGAKEPALTLDKGSRLQLSQGSVELNLSNGVQALVRAPADLTLHEENRLYQSLGIARYIVPPSGIGFQVKTPDLLITDLGTEFGVISSPDKLDQVHLFEGKVEVENQWGLQKKELLKGVQSRVAGPAGRLQLIQSHPELFMTSLEDKPSHLHLSFDQLEDDQFTVLGNHSDVPDISASLLESTREDKTPGLTTGKFGKALELHGHGGCVQTNWQGISGNAPRSVAFWVRLPSTVSFARQRGILNWGDTGVPAGKFELIVNQNPDKGQIGAIRFDCGQGHVIGETDLYDDEWHHVAVIMGGIVDSTSGMPVQLYVDGELEAVTGFMRNDPDTIAGTDESTWMSVGRYPHPADTRQGYLIGSIDELYIFSGVLTPSDVQQVMRGDW